MSPSLTRRIPAHGCSFFPLPRGARPRARQQGDRARADGDSRGRGLRGDRRVRALGQEALHEPGVGLRRDSRHYARLDREPRHHRQRALRAGARGKRGADRDALAILVRRLLLARLRDCREGPAPGPHPRRRARPERDAPRPHHRARSPRGFAHRRPRFTRQGEGGAARAPASSAWSSAPTRRSSR
jgi:hypothetical protein